MAWVYILTNRPNGTLYVGVTKDLIRRIYEHRSGNVDSFSRKHGLKRLVYFEEHATVPLAIQREKNMKRWPRSTGRTGNGTICLTRSCEGVDARDKRGHDEREAQTLVIAAPVPALTPSSPG
jgi:putative endonuclease